MSDEVNVYQINGATQRFVDTDGVSLSVYDAGEGPAVVFSHGWPELAYSWRAQLPALGAAGFHAIAPDQRGYGGSDVPDAQDDYDIVHVTADLVAVLDAFEIEEAVFCGHDWGGIIVWNMPLLYPDRTAGVIGVNTPATPRLPMSLPRMFEAGGQTPDDNYILFFQEPGRAEAVFEADGPRALFSTLMRRGVPIEEVMEHATSANPFNEGFRSMAEIGRPLLDENDLPVYVDAFEASGFTGGLNYYRNLDRNWELTRDVAADATIDVPCLMITAEWDPVLRPEMAEPMKGFIGDLEIAQIAECGHWTQQEKPDELNSLIIDWLDRRFRP